MDKRKFINTIKEYLDLTDFKAIAVGAGSVSLVKINTEIMITYLKYPHIFRFRPSIAGYITFPEIENILEPFYKKYNLGYQPYTIYKSSRRFEHLSSIDLYIPADIHKVGSELKTMVYEDILPFFEQYQNISSVLMHMESLAKEDVSSFICHSPVPRMMVLKKIGGSTDWIEFCEWAVDIYEKMAADSINDQTQYSLIFDLYEKLKTI